MSLGPKTITVFLDASPSGRKRVVHAAALAQRWGAHLVGVTQHSPLEADGRSAKSGGIIARRRPQPDELGGCGARPRLERADSVRALALGQPDS
jgi:hypothetical protein